MKIYITGGTGFIGSYIVKELVNAGHDIHILARNTEKVPSLLDIPNITIHNAPLDNIELLDKAIHKPDALIHVALGWGDTGPDMIKNETLKSVELIDLAIKKGVKKVIFTSSTAAVGYSHKDTNETSLRKPTDFYGATKGAVELFIKAYSNYYPNIAFNIIRPGYTFGNPAFDGSDMQPDKRIHDICKAVKNKEQLELAPNDGTQFIWAGHLAEIYKKVIESDIKDEIFFGLSKNFTSWKQIEKWAHAINNDIDVNTVAEEYPDNLFLFDMKAIRNHFKLSYNSDKALLEHVRFVLKAV